MAQLVVVSVALASVLLVIVFVIPITLVSDERTWLVRRTAPVS